MVEFDQLWLIFFLLQFSLPYCPHSYSIGIAAPGFPWYSRSHPDPRRTLQGQIWPHHQSNTASQAIVFVLWFHVGGDGEHSQMLPNQDNYGGWSTSLKLQSRTAVTATEYLCTLLSGWSLPSSVFQTDHAMSPVLLFKVLNHLSSVGLSGRK